MNTIKSKRIKAFTLVEMLIVIVLLIVVLIMISQIFLSIHKYNQILSSQTDLMRQKREITRVMGQDIRNSCNLYPGTIVTIEGVSYKVPASDGSGGTELLMAIPEYVKSTGLISSYTIIGYYLVGNSSDVNNKNSYNLIRCYYPRVIPVIQNDPSTINLAALKGGTKKVCARYLLKSGYVLTISNSGVSVGLTASLRETRTKTGQPAEDRLSFTMNRRNI